MTAFWLTFDISTTNVGGHPHHRRRGDLYGVIDSVVIPQGSDHLIWKDTTSCMVFRSGQSLGEIAQKIKNVISQDYDLFLLKCVDTPAAIICGRIKNPHIFEQFLSKGKTYLIDITDDQHLTVARKHQKNLRYLEGSD